MAPDKIDITGDPRIEHKFADLNGHRYHYLHGKPKGEVKASIFLIHGWPDLSAGWRYQIPVLLSLGLQVIAPDMMGYGQTEAPRVPPASIQLYTFKRASDDLAELARQLGLSRIAIGGHDWGGMVVWRFALLHPALVSHVFSVCSPYTPPMPMYFDRRDLIKGPLPQFAYQEHLASPEVEARVQTPEQIGQFLRGMFGARTPEGRSSFSPTKGVLFDELPKLGKTPLLDDKEVEYYTQQYSRNGLHGTVNWYRTWRANWENDQALVDTVTITQPSLFIAAKKDNVLKPELARKMGDYIPRLTLAEVNANHWALWEKPEECSTIIKNWVEKVVLSEQAKL